jgi:hypothetical protein
MLIDVDERGGCPTTRLLMTRCRRPTGTRMREEMPSLYGESTNRFCFNAPDFNGEYPLSEEPYVSRVKMEAWNNFIVEVAQPGAGRLHPQATARAG